MTSLLSQTCGSAMVLPIQRYGYKSDYDGGGDFFKKNCLNCSIQLFICLPYCGQKLNEWKLIFAIVV